MCLHEAWNGEEPRLTAALPCPFVASRAEQTAWPIRCFAFETPWNICENVRDNEFVRANWVAAVVRERLYDVGGDFAYVDAKSDQTIDVNSGAQLCFTNLTRVADMHIAVHMITCRASMTCSGMVACVVIGVAGTATVVSGRPPKYYIVPVQGCTTATLELHLHICAAHPCVFMKTSDKMHRAGARRESGTPRPMARVGAGALYRDDRPR